MNSFSIDTTLPFPILELEENVYSTEVKKPSGVAYMVLVLLKESKNKSLIFSRILETFGVPKTLHQIFSDEIAELINQGILVVNNPEGKKYDALELNDFRFTELGETVFKEEQITTGNQKQNQIKVYYDIASDTLSLKPDSELDAKPLKNSVLDDKFYLQFNCNKDIKEFFNTKKGPSFKVKAAEVITKVEERKRSNYVGKYNCKFEVSNNSLNIAFDYNVAAEFSDKYYTCDFINKAISFKDKFKLDSPYEAKLTDIDEGLFNRVILASDYKNILKKRHSLIIARKIFNVAGGIVINYSNTLDKFYKNLDYILVDNNQILGYAPVRLEVSYKDGKIYLPVVAELKLPVSEFNKSINTYLDQYKEYCYESFAKIVKICSYTKNDEEVIHLLNSYMGKYNDDNITILNEVKPLMSTNSLLIEEYKKLLKENIISYLENVTEDNIETTVKLTKNLYSYIGFTRDAYLNKIFTSLKIKNKVSLFEELVDKPFTITELLAYINPFDELLSKKESKVDKLNNVIIYNSKLEELKALTKIDNYLSYSLNYEDINKSKVKEAFITIKSLEKYLKEFRASNLEYFNSAEGFIRIFSKINDAINQEEAALKNPKNITPELIDKKITNGDYQFVLLNLSVKLEYSLKENFGFDGKLSERLDAAKRKKIIDKKTIEDLHKFRNVRNSMIHPENRNEEYTADDLRRWSEEIFSIKEMK